MNTKIFDSELKLLNIIWDNEPISAKKISVIAAEKFEWNINTTYTVLKKLEAKKYINRSDHGFICTAIVSKEEIRRSETKNLIDKLFGGSRKALFSSLLGDEDLTVEEINEIKKKIEKR